MSGVDWAALAAEFDAALAHAHVDFRARSNLLYREDYRRLDGLARDLRSSGPFPMPFLESKRKYQWAVDGWLFGRLSASEFLARRRSFERDLSAAFECIDRMEAVHREEAAYRNSAEQWMKWIRRWNREGFVSRVGWRQWFEKTQQAKEMNERWARDRRQRAQTAHQRAYLRQGLATMRAIRRVLRGQDPLPPLASTPAKSSPTS